jgi:hypothetical protein
VGTARHGEWKGRRLGDCLGAREGGHVPRVELKNCKGFFYKLLTHDDRSNRCFKYSSIDIHR